MFRSTDKQVPLLTAGTHLPASSERRLKSSWAQGFRDKIYPVLLDVEAEFSDLHASGTGRPNWSVARKLGVCLLQDMLDLDDQSALDSLAFDVRWQFAMELVPEQAYLSRRSLVAFRSRLVELDPGMERMRRLFDRIGQEAIDDLELAVDSQRIDSTFITSNIRTRGRLDLFNKTLGHFLEWLSSQAPAKLEQLSDPLRQWYERTERGYFSKPKQNELRAKLEEVAGWLVEVSTRFADDNEVRDSGPYLLVVRLVSEHCKVIELEPTEGDEGPGAPGPDGCDHDEADANDAPGADTDVQLVVLDSPVNAGASMQSPHDPDAGYGHKGKGYLVQVTETCNNEGQPEIITDYALQPSNGSDHGQTTEALDRLVTAGKAPQTLYADAGYASSAAYLEAEQRGVQLEAPVPTKQPSESLTREHFLFDGEGRIVQCPEGHAPFKHADRVAGPSGSVPHAYFHASTCRACPQFALCPVKAAKGAQSAILNISDEARVRDEAIVVQRTEMWWREYAIRTGIEATNSELKRAHGFGKLRVRTRPRVLFAVVSKLTACNIKRWLRAKARAARTPETDPTPSRPSRSGQLLPALLLQATGAVLSWLHMRLSTPWSRRSLAPVVHHAA